MQVGQAQLEIRQEVDVIIIHQNKLYQTKKSGELFSTLLF